MTTITIGSGNAKKSYFVPSSHSAAMNPSRKIIREKLIDDMKSLLFRPGVPRQIIE